MTLKKIEDPNKAYKYLKLNSRAINQSHWITKGIAKLSKKKQRLYEKFLQNRTPQNEETYKTYKTYLKPLKGHQKKKKKKKKLFLRRKIAKV